MQVYNCTSGQVNKILVEEMFALSVEYAIKYPSKYTALYPSVVCRTNRLVHWFHTAVYHYIPAYIYDAFLYCNGEKPM